MDKQQIIDFLSENKVELQTTMDTGKIYKSTSNLGLSGLMSTIHRFLKSAIPEITFTSDFPTGVKTEELPGPIITYKVLDRVPTPGRGLKPRLRETIPDPDNPGHMINIMAQSFDCEIQFNIYSDRAYEIDGLGCNREPEACSRAQGLCNQDFKPPICPYSIDGVLDRFENFILDYMWYFMDKVGVQQMHFLRQEEDNTDTSINTPMMKRSIVYFITIERQWIIRTADISTIDIDADI